MSALLDDCLANGRDLVFGGTRYNLPGIAIYGPSNVYDALMAIRTLVYEQQRVSWDELLQALQADFQGYEPLRQMLAHAAPRFGNDIEEIDQLANQINAIHNNAPIPLPPEGGRGIGASSFQICKQGLTILISYDKLRANNRRQQKHEKH